MTHHKLVTVRLTVPPSNFLSICALCTSVYMCIFLTVLCVYISRGAVCYEVIVSCRGSSMVKVTQVGSCQMAVHPSLGQGVPVPPVRARGERGRRRGVWGWRVPCCLGPAPGCRASSPGWAAASSCLLYSSLACPVTCWYPQHWIHKRTYWLMICINAESHSGFLPLCICWLQVWSFCFYCSWITDRKDGY